MYREMRTIFSYAGVSVSGMLALGGIIGAIEFLASGTPNWVLIAVGIVGLPGLVIAGRSIIRDIEQSRKNPGSSRDS